MGSFDQLTNYVVFSSWIFYGLVCAGVIVLRRKRPELARPYRVIGYPYVPAMFVLVSLLPGVPSAAGVLAAIGERAPPGCVVNCAGAHAPR